MPHDNLTLDVIERNYRRHLEIQHHMAFDLWRESRYADEALYDKYMDAKADLQRWIDNGS